LNSLEHHFPDARIIRRAVADAKVAEVLKDFPRSLAFRSTNLLAPKVFDFVVFLESQRMALFDSDLLFFSRPHAYLERLESLSYDRNCFNRDVSDVYTVELSDVHRVVGHDVVPKINTGFGLIHRDSVRWDWTEEFLGLPGILDGHFWRIEQTLLALCSSRYGAELLPDEYAVRLEPGIGGRPFRHYVGAIRHLMYGEGIRHLVSNQAFLQQAAWGKALRADGADRAGS
jgi:hypothetical protein